MVTKLILVEWFPVTGAKADSGRVIVANIKH